MVLRKDVLPVPALPNIKMLLSDFNYDLPKKLIAQIPLENRDFSKMLVLNKQKQILEDKHFFDILEMF